MGDTISPWSNSNNSYGFGIQGSQLQIHTDISDADIVFGYGSSVSSNETMRINESGKVGIGTTAPGFPLNFPNTVGDKISLLGNSGAYYGFGVQNFLLQIHTPAFTDDVVFGYGSSNSFTETMRIKGTGNVGIGTSSPGFPLNFANSLGDKISLWGTSGPHYGFGIQGSLLQIHSTTSIFDIAFDMAAVVPLQKNSE